MTDNIQKSKSKAKDKKPDASHSSPTSDLSSVTSTKTLEDDQEFSTALRLKRRHVYDSLEHCRALKSKSLDKDSKQQAGPSTSKGEPPADEQVEIGSRENTLDFIESLRSKSSSKSGRYHDTSMDGQPSNLKITTWNINGLRSWLKKRSGLAFIAQDDADIYCFQETKCQNANLPNEIKNVPGYNCYWNGSNDRHSGVVCFVKSEPLNVTYGIGSSIFDREGRVIALEYQRYYVINVYVPNAGRKLVRLNYRLEWDLAFYDYLKRLDAKKPIIVCGDLNVSHRDVDLANPKTNTKTAGYTIEERENFSKLLSDLNLVDVFRYFNPDKRDCYTYWTFMRNARERNIGWRLDYFLISGRLLEKTCDCIIRNDVYGSDHCPVSIFLSI